MELAITIDRTADTCYPRYPRRLRPGFTWSCDQS